MKKKQKEAVASVEQNKKIRQRHHDVVTKDGVPPVKM